MQKQQHRQYGSKDGDCNNRQNCSRHCSEEKSQRLPAAQNPPDNVGQVAGGLPPSEKVGKHAYDKDNSTQYQETKKEIAHNGKDDIHNFGKITKNNNINRIKWQII
jgi:hypothetical protein